MGITRAFLPNRLLASMEYVAYLQLFAPELSLKKDSVRQPSRVPTIFLIRT